MKKLLITGFDPFGGQKVNPSWECVFALNEVIGEFSVEKLQIPTVFEKAFLTVKAKADLIQPDVIICVGQAGGRKAVTPEMVAINLKDATTPDNEGNTPKDEKICFGGETAYFTTLPIKKMIERVKSENLPCQISYSAGTFVCNETFYRLSKEYYGTQVKVGFIHVPFLPSQAQNGEPSMPLEDIVKAITLAITAI